MSEIADSSDARAKRSVSQRLGALVVAAFAIVFTRTPWVIRLLKPAMTRQLLSPSRDPGPNALLTVRGRRTGRPLTCPVAFLDLGQWSLVQASSAEVGWVRNIRATREAVITRRGEAKKFDANELAPEVAGPLIREMLAPFPRSRLVAAVVGAVNRPPVPVLRYFQIRIDDSLPEYVANARRQPVFELRPSESSK